MKKILYVYLLDTMAEWEVAYLLQGIGMQAQLGITEDPVELKMVSHNLDPIKTLGGFTILPDISLDEMCLDDMVGLILPGGQKWQSPKHAKVLSIAKSIVDTETLLAGICGSSLELARMGLLDQRSHTSNSLSYLTYFLPDYKGASYYKNTLSTRDNNLVTASAAGGLQWAKDIFEYLNIYKKDVLQAWYNYFKSGLETDYLAMMEANGMQVM